MSEKIDLSCVSVLCGHAEVPAYKPLVPFASQVLDFLADVGLNILNSSVARSYPDVITFGFFCRKASLLQLEKKYKDKIENRIGRGLSFHIAPSNVPVNFAYTLISGLLAGNSCVVKASSKDFTQTHIICDSFNTVLENYSFLKPYINVVMYDRDRVEITEYYSSHCNVRVIWGGDETVKAIKSICLPPRGIDLAFADRYSICVINASAVQKTILYDNGDEKIKSLAQDFYNDTYLYDQNACSSPHLIYWLGEKKEVDEAKRIFWDAIYDNIKERYRQDPLIAVNKLTAVYRTSIAINGTKLEKNKDNRIVRVDVPCLVKDLPDLREVGGFFQEYTDTTLESLVSIITDKYQTMAYYGFEKKDLVSFVVDNGLQGIDRIVPLGHTADFGLLWDGYDLILTLSRIIA